MSGSKSKMNRIASDSQHPSKRKIVHKPSLHGYYLVVFSAEVNDSRGNDRISDFSNQAFINPTCMMFAFGEGDILFDLQ